MVRIDDEINEVTNTPGKLHPSFQKLWDQGGSGYYWYATRLGMGSIFYLSSTGVYPYNPPQERAVSPYHDFYDALRAVEEGFVQRLDPVANFRHEEQEFKENNG